MTDSAYQRLVPEPLSPLPVLLSCDHASALFPDALAHSWLHADDQARHVIVDIGVAEVTRMVSAGLGVSALLPSFSKLVCDLNREPTHPENIRPHYDALMCLLIKI